jgi:predicted ester cyclase
MSVIEDNEQIGRRFLALVSEHDIDGLIAMITPTWTMHGGPPGLPAGEAGIRQLFATFGRIKQRWTVEDVIATVDKVAVRATNTVDQDTFLGIPSHGHQQVFTAMFIHHITGGLISQTWRNADDLGRLLQLGARIEPSRPESQRRATRDR